MRLRDALATDPTCDWLDCHALATHTLTQRGISTSQYWQRPRWGAHLLLLCDEHASMHNSDRRLRRFGPNTEAPKEPGEILGSVLCACGHELRRHDPEDARCDAPTSMIDTLGQCSCRCARSSDPSLTLDELRLRALAEAGYVLCREQVGWVTPGGAFAGYRNPLVQPDVDRPVFVESE